MGVRFKFNLKEPQNEESLLMVICRWDNQPIKLSTRQRVFVATWNVKKQLCITSKELFPPRINRHSKSVNSFLERLSSKLIDYYNENYSSSTSVLQAKNSIKSLIDSLVENDRIEDEKKKVTPIHFFEEYIAKKRIDPHTGRYISDRTKVHQKTVIHRLKAFLADNNLPDDFSVFTSSKFDRQYTEWCYSVKKYRQNTEHS